ncbi:MAG TPA: hypothetical protein VM290_11825 [Gaiellaceae bacterium]|jgi:hypothetical protein|nr:hypothetical protein [Gaiellaceae bacterium]
MRFPEDGDYVFPGALAPLYVRGGVGSHVEPNVWVRHALRRSDDGDAVAPGRRA